MDDPVTRGILNMVCFLACFDYVLWVMDGPYWTSI